MTMQTNDAALETFPGGLRKAARRQLQSGEQVLWAGQPDIRRALPEFALYLIAAPWTFLSFRFEAMAVAAMRSGDSLNRGNWHWLAVMAAVWGAPFVMIGLGLFATPLVSLLRMRETGYLITNRRAVIIVGTARNAVRSASRDQFRSAACVERGDGSGDIILEQAEGIGSTAVCRPRLVFSYLRNVREVKHVLDMAG